MKVMQAKNDYPYEQYQKDIVDTYRYERKEVYYYSVIRDFIRTLCSEEEKVVEVFDNKGTSSIHNKDAYTVPGGLQDMIIVPKEYQYEKPVPPYITIEIKKPDMDLENNKVIRYNAIKHACKGRLNGQLEVQFQRTSYIIYTDCITWYFLEKDSEPKTVCLLKEDGDNWKFTCGEDSDTALYNSGDIHQIEAEPKEWIKLKGYLREFIERSKNHYPGY